MFVLPFEIKKAPFDVSIRDKVVLMGSCFSENIGKKLSDHKFNVLINPFGVIYNPISIFKTLDQSISTQVSEDRIVEIDHIYYHWDAHSALSAASREDLIKKLHEQQDLTRSALHKSSTLILSPGTSWVYHHQSNHSIVANCHKVPQKEFTKSLLSGEEITRHYFEVIEKVRSINPQINVILTVSPVRHIRDGLVENNLSKSILIQAVQEIVKRDQKASYFPSYEILIDVLRDYRFYKEDMIHPSDQGIEYIWQKFKSAYFDQETLNFIEEWEKLTRALKHRPFHPGSPAHQSFLKSTAKRLQSFSSIVNVEEELKSIEKQLLDA
ncbi:MAG: GSCFA domain-containing protein [Cyclobacteriaceae bacterium]|nr:GSCFA domain-containing protein [Cyclobacteriaceae bacterium SS2]